MSTSKKITILLVILALAAAGVWAVGQIINKKSVTLPADNTIDQARQQEFDQALKKVSAVDQDLDGMSDSEEDKYKTNVTSSDSDEDGLTDWQEIFIYKTDPLKADTDGDGFVDGYEVRRNLNPVVAEKAVR